jgi:hypothetical protein
MVTRDLCKGDTDTTYMLFLQPTNMSTAYPRQLKTYHDNFCVKKNFIPTNTNENSYRCGRNKSNSPVPLISCGSAPVKPNESGNHATSHLFPNCSSKYRCPNTICRTNASPEGIFASFSTHEPPIGWKEPLRTCCFTRSKSGG